MPLPEDRPFAILGFLFCLLCVPGVWWKLYTDAHTVIDVTGLSRPSLRGRQKIAWQEVTDIKIFNGAGFHAHAGRHKIVVSPAACQDPQGVIKALQDYSAPYLQQRTA